MLAINTNGSLQHTHTGQNDRFKRFTINTLVFFWKLVWNTLAFIFRAFAFCCKAVCYLLVAITAIILFRPRR